MPYGLVAGHGANPRVQRQCAQILIDAAGHLARAKPASAAGYRVTCSINMPDMFISEVCIYGDDELYRHQTSLTEGRSDIQGPLEGSLAKKWGLRVPEGFSEFDRRMFYEDDEDGDYHSEWWWFVDMDQ